MMENKAQTIQLTIVIVESTIVYIRKIEIQDLRLVNDQQQMRSFKCI